MTDQKKVGRAPPFDRKKIHPQLVTGADPFSLLMYQEKREETPALWELEQQGKIPGMPAVLADTAFALWAEEPGVKEEVSADRRYWRDLLRETTTTPAFKSLSANTQGDWLLSTLGTIEAAREILRLVPKEDAKKLDEVDKAQAEADSFEQAASDAEAQAQAFEELLAQMTAQAQAGGQQDGQPTGQASGGGQPQPGAPNGQAGGQTLGQGTGSANDQSQTNGSFGLTAEQAQRLADEIAKAKTVAVEAKQLAEMAKAEADAKADELLGKPGSAEAHRKLTELRRLGIGALAKAANEVKETANTIRCWGLDPGELNEMPVPEAQELLQKMRRNADFKEFAEMLGRLRPIARAKAKGEDKGESRQVPREELGRDLSRLVPAELAAYAAHPATRAGFYQRWANGTLRLRGTETRNKPQGRGSVVVCEDSSGSMDGARRRWAKANCLALASYANAQRRRFGWIMFDTIVQKVKSYRSGRIPAKDLLEIAEASSGGGTNFEAPLRRAMKMIDEEGLQKAHIVFITDGECAISKEFLAEFLRWKKDKEVMVVTVIVDNHISDATVKQFSDRVERASSFTVEEAETKVFANL